MPAFFTDGNTPNVHDTRWRILQKILGVGGTGGGGGGGGTGLSGSGSPEGSVTADPGTTYWDTTNDSLWVKDTGTGNTGWYQVVA